MYIIKTDSKGMFVSLLYYVKTRYEKMYNKHTNYILIIQNKYIFTVIGKKKYTNKKVYKIYLGKMKNLLHQIFRYRKIQ